jgi:choline kinase
MVRVSDKPAISYIIESYPSDIEFIITLGHFATHVKQFLPLAYPNHKFTFVDIDNYKGVGSSLGYSLLKCKEVVDSPFIFHASDTIIKNYEPEIPTENYVISCKKKDNFQYRTLHNDKNRLIRINEKGELNYDHTYIGVAGIKDHEIFFQNLENLIDEKKEDVSDTHSINLMLSKVNFKVKFINQNDWFDVGNSTELNRTRKSFHSNVEVLDKVDESIFFFDDFIIKFFYNSIINRNRVARAYHLGDLVPEIIDSTENFFKYKKAIGELFSKTVQTEKFKYFLEWSTINLWKLEKNESDTEFKKKCYNFYITKTKERISQYLKNNIDQYIINGQLVEDVYHLIDSIDSDWICDGIPSNFHGDFILDNIIETSDGFKLIDWRQDFAGDLKIGDLYYDLAKLNHNLTVNHEIVNQNLFNFSNGNCYILINSKLKDCEEILHSFILEKNLDLKKVKVLTSIIWLNMAPLHEHNLSNFLYNFGKYNLQKNLKL